MPIPPAYRKLRKDLAEKSAEASRSATQMSKWYDEEEANYYKKVLNALIPYNKAKIEGHILAVKSRAIKREVDLLLGGQLWWTFHVERQREGPCGCDGPCGCERRTWAGVRCVFHLPGEESYESYFEHGDWSDDDIAKGIMTALKNRQQVVELYQWRKRRKAEN